MIDILIKTYTVNLDDKDYSPSRNDINTKGFDVWFNDQINVFLNCSRTLQCGQRCIQTNDPRYKREISLTLKMIDEYADKEKSNDYIAELINRHKANIEFEALNGLDYSVKKKGEKKRKEPARRKDATNLSIPSIDKFKITNLKLNIKPYKNDTL